MHVVVCRSKLFIFTAVLIFHYEWLFIHESILLPVYSCTISTLFRYKQYSNILPHIYAHRISLRLEFLGYSIFIHLILQNNVQLFPSGCAYFHAYQKHSGVSTAYMFTNLKFCQTNVNFCPFRWCKMSLVILFTLNFLVEE